MKIETGNIDAKTMKTKTMETKTLKTWRRAYTAVKRILQIHRQPRRLRLCESLPLGDRRFVAVVEFEQSRFLVGGTAGSLVLLAKLEGLGDECRSEKCVEKNNNIATESAGAPTSKIHAHQPVTAMEGSH
jgi:flagellar biogenesis protein FliO